MSKFIAVGLGAAAVVGVLLVGGGLLGAPAPNQPGAAPTATPSITAEPSEAAPSTAPAGGLPEAPFLVFDPTTQPAPFDDGVPITVTVSAPGWTAEPSFGALMKGDQADPPDGTGIALLTADTGGDAFFVYGDPCHWETTKPASPATSVEAFAAALAAQPTRNASTPVDVTIGGHHGKKLTLTVPMDEDTRAGAFQDCDQQTFGTFTVGDLDSPTRYQQGPGQIDEYWIVDVNGSIAVLDLMYSPATPTQLVEEGRALAESATFE